MRTSAASLTSLMGFCPLAAPMIEKGKSRITLLSNCLHLVIGSELLLSTTEKLSMRATLNSLAKVTALKAPKKESMYVYQTTLSESIQASRTEVKAALAAIQTHITLEAIVVNHSQTLQLHPSAQIFTRAKTKTSTIPTNKITLSKEIAAWAACQIIRE